MFRIIIHDSIYVPHKEFMKENEYYREARNFCKRNQLNYFDDTDLLEFYEEKQELNERKNVSEVPFEFGALEEIINYLKHYNMAEWKWPNPSYYIENDKIIHYNGWLDYQDNGKIFAIPKFLKEHGFVDESYYNRKKYPEFFEEEMSEYDFKNLDYKRVSYTLLRIFQLERMHEGLVDQFARNGFLLELIIRAEYFKKIQKKDKKYL